MNEGPGGASPEPGIRRIRSLFGSSLIGVRGQTVKGQSMPALRAIESTIRVYIEPPTRHLTEEK